MRDVIDQLKTYAEAAEATVPDPALAVGHQASPARRRLRLRRTGPFIPPFLDRGGNALPEIEILPGPSDDGADGAGDEPSYLAPPADPRRRGAVAVAIASVAAVLAATFGVLSLTGSDGPGSPEAAIQSLFDAIGHEDAIGVLQSVAPSERSSLKDGIEDMAGELKRLDVAGGNLDLNDVGGVQLDVTGLELTTSDLGDGVSAVHVTSGRITSNIQADQLPVGSVLRELFDQQRREGDEVIDGGAKDLTGLELVAIHEDGGWWFSPWYSIAELIRRDSSPEPAVPDFGHGIAATGAASPEGAVREAIDAAVELDVRRLIELTPADEMRALHDYGPLLVEAVGDADTGTGPPPDIRYTLKVSDASGGRKVVEATTYSYAYGDEHDGVRAGSTYDGRCVTDTAIELIYGNDGEGPTSAKPVTSRHCRGDDSATGVGLGSDLSGLRVVVEEHDGRWFISPTRSVFASVLAMTGALDPAGARLLVRTWSGETPWIPYADEFWEACGVAKPPTDAAKADGEAALQRCFDQLPTDYEGPYATSGLILPFFFLRASTVEESSSAEAASTTVVFSGTTVPAPAVSETVSTTTAGTGDSSSGSGSGSSDSVPTTTVPEATSTTAGP